MKATEFLTLFDCLFSHVLRVIVLTLLHPPLFPLPSACTFDRLLIWNTCTGDATKECRIMLSPLAVLIVDNLFVLRSSVLYSFYTTISPMRLQKFNRRYWTGTWSAQSWCWKRRRALTSLFVHLINYILYCVHWEDDSQRSVCDVQYHCDSIWTVGRKHYNHYWIAQL